MSWNEWANVDATDLAALIKKGDITASEVAQQARLASAKTNPAINAVIEVFDDAVNNPDKKTINAGGHFSGVPIMMKDLGPGVKGRLQEQGSRFFKGYKPSGDAFLTTKIRQAGFNIIGRTTTPEFGVCSSAENPEIYVTRNPWNTDYTSFGSSAGAATSVAAGVLPIAHGTDGGGSIRIPAGAQGLVGLKCSRGVFSVSQSISDITGYVSTQGCISRSVRDTAGFVDACRGGAPGEFMPYWKSDEPYTQTIQKDPRRLKIAVSSEWGDYKADPHFVSELEKTAEHLRALGHQVEWVTPDIDFNASYKAQTLCYISNFAQFIQNQLEAKGLTAPTEDLFEPINILLWEKGKDILYRERWLMQDTFNQISRQLGAFYEAWDIILTPSIAKATPLIGEKKYLTISHNQDVMDWFRGIWGIFAFTPLANQTGTPGISLPLAWQQSGIPLGMHFQTRQANDGLLLQLAAQLERAAGGRFNKNIFPKVHVTRD
ncbi:amidase [Pantoea rwandensis]|nr:amidase [Pantoea rwandensis]